MAVSFEGEPIIQAAIAGIPRVAEVIAANDDDEHRAKALEAAERSYRQTVLSLGYAGAAAKTWSFVILFRLQGESKLRELAKRKVLDRLQKEMTRTRSGAVQECLR